VFENRVEETVLRSSTICTLLQKLGNEDDQIKEDEMGTACSTHGGNKKFIQNFG
jgi:hypothetical protein